MWTTIDKSIIVYLLQGLLYPSAMFCNPTQWPLVRSGNLESRAPCRSKSFPMCPCYAMGPCLIRLIHHMPPGAHRTDLTRHIQNSLYLPIHPSICLSIYASIHLSIYLSIYPSLCLSIYLCNHIRNTFSLHTQMHTYTYTLSTYRCTWIHVYTWKYVCIYIYTHTHASACFDVLPDSHEFVLDPSPTIHSHSHLSHCSRARSPCTCQPPTSALEPGQ